MMQENDSEMEEEEYKEDGPRVSVYSYPKPVDFGLTPSISKMIDGTSIAISAGSSLLLSSWDRVSLEIIPVSNNK